MTGRTGLILAMLAAALFGSACASAAANQRLPEKGVTYLSLEKLPDGKVALVRDSGPQTGMIYFGLRSSSGSQMPCVECLKYLNYMVHIVCLPADCNPPVLDPRGTPDPVIADKFKADLRADPSGELVLEVRVPAQ
jgi:hypothetical protein